MEQKESASFDTRIKKILPERADISTFGEDYNISAETFSFFEDVLKSKGFVEFESMTDAYKKIDDKTLVVRREDPRKVLQLLGEPGHYEVGFESDRYSNCVEWNPYTDGSRGIHNAYMEGMTNLNSVVTVIGFNRQPDQDIVKLPDASINFHGLERDKVRSFKGTITLENVAVINLRIPGHLLSEAKLTIEELDRVDEYISHKEKGLPANPVMVHRSFVKNTTEESIH